MVSLVGADDRRVTGQREVDARVRHQVGLQVDCVFEASFVEATKRNDVVVVNKSTIMCVAN
jgi:hypothetical protein